MIGACGLPTQNFTDDLVETAFAAYRDKLNRQKYLDKLKDCNMFDAKITMVGVWDTVGSLGIPSAIGFCDPVFYGFLDTSLGSHILNGYHALAIDEKRAQFPPTLWTSTPVPGQTIEQVWFVGVHSDIGGGEPDCVDGVPSLSDITLSWMMSKANALGLQFDANVLAQCTVPLPPEYSLDKLHASWSVLCGFPRHRSIATDSILANSVKIRCQHDGTYRPDPLRFEQGALSAVYKFDQIVNSPDVAE
jgi:hypothetical protein